MHITKHTVVIQLILWFQVTYSIDIPVQLERTLSTIREDSIGQAQIENKTWINMKNHIWSDVKQGFDRFKEQASMYAQDGSHRNYVKRLGTGFEKLTNSSEGQNVEIHMRGEDGDSNVWATIKNGADKSWEFLKNNAGSFWEGVEKGFNVVKGAIKQVFR